MSKTKEREEQKRFAVPTIQGFKTAAAELVTGESGQGTTEYAILVGVLVVIAILSIVTFRGKVQELWDAIANGMGSL